MKIGRWSRLLLAALPLIAGCGNFWQAPSTTTTTTTTTLTSGKFYVLNAATSQIVAYYVNAGTLTQVASYTLKSTVSTYPAPLTVSPNNAFLYVSTSGGIYLYTIASDGTLTIGNSGSPITSDVASSMQVDSTNGWLVETAIPSGSSYYYLNAIAIDSSTGALASSGESEQSVALPSGATSVNQLAISPDNSYIFVAMGTAGTGYVPFTSGNTNPFGSVNSFSVERPSSSGAAISVAVDPSNRLFYVGEVSALSGSNSGGLRVFNFSTLKSGGTIAELTGSPFTTSGTSPTSILPESTGSYVYVANRYGSSPSVIAGYSVTSSTLTALSSTFSAGGSQTVGLVEDSTKKFIFAVNYGGSYDLTGFVFDSTTASNLDETVYSSTGTDPVEATAIAALH